MNVYTLEYTPTRKKEAHYGQLAKSNKGAIGMADFDPVVYVVAIERSAARALKALEPDALRKALREAIEALAEEPRPDGCTKLAGMRHTYRIRVGCYRAVYKVNDQEKSVDVISVRNRGDVYRRR